MNKSSIFVVLGVTFSFQLQSQAQLFVPREKPFRIPQLSGDELLCEIETGSYSGIFAVDAGKQQSKPLPLVENAHSPKWAPKHTVFSFFRAGIIWVGDLKGHTYPIAKIPRQAENFKLDWDVDGRLYCLYGMPDWTHVFARGMDLTEDFARTRLQSGKWLKTRLMEEIIMKSEVSSEMRPVEFETEEDGKQVKSSRMVSPKVKATGAVAFSTVDRQFVMQVGDEFPYGILPQSHLWLFKGIHSNVNDPGYSEEKYAKIIRENDYSRFYTSNFIPNATFIKELTGQNKEVFERHPIWSPDGKMLAYTQVNIAKEEAWPHVLMGAGLEKDVAVSIPNYLPPETERWAKKSVEVLSWEPDGTLFLIEGTREKIYKAKQTLEGFEASVFVEATYGNKPNILYPAFYKEQLAYVLSGDEDSVVHLKNYKTGEERLLKLTVAGRTDGLIKNLNW